MDEYIESERDIEKYDKMIQMPICKSIEKLNFLRQYETPAAVYQIKLT